MSSDTGTAGAWRRRAWALAARINLGRLLATWTPAALLSSLAAAVALLALRRIGGDVAPVWLGLAAVVVVTLAIAALRARRRGESLADAFVRLDVALGLHNRLTAAHAGVGPWPPLPARTDAVVRWRLLRAAGPLGLAAALLLAAASVPVSKGTASAPWKPEPPPAWKEIEETLDGLAERELVADEAEKAWEERLNHLRHQPEDTWYGHGSLEAGDTLREQLEMSVRSLGDGLDQAAEALESLPNAQRDRELKAVESRLQGALEGLSASSLPLDRRLLDRLKEVKASSPRSLDLKELSALSQRMREGAGFCKASLRECRPGDPHCVSWGRGRSARGGNGGIDRGPGSVPLSLDPDAVTLDPTREEGLTNDDLEHAALGDTLGLSRGAHDVDDGAYRGPVAGGSAALGDGGRAVERLPTTPEERRVLERYFR